MSVGGSPLSPPADSHVRTAAAGNGKSADCFGRLLEDRGDLAEAETFYRQAADHGPAWAMVNHGCLLAEQGQMAEAEQLWRQAAAVGDENIRVTAVGKMERRPRWWRRLWER